MTSSIMVETYEDVEISSDGQPDDLEAVRKLATELGLEGQCIRLTPDEGDVNPYREMTKDELFAYATLCERHEKVADYQAGIIPLRVLQIIAHAKQFYESLEVWHSCTRPDPILVGIFKEGQYNHRNHILARWGEHLKPLAECLAEAKRLMLEKIKGRLLAVKHELEGDIKRAEAGDTSFEADSRVTYYSPYRS